MDIDRKNLQFSINFTNNILEWAFNNFQDKIFSTTAFGVNGIVLLDFLKQKKKNIKIYFIDTGYHFSETLKIKNYYKNNGFNIIDVSSNIDKTKNSLCELGFDLCCSINKVEPMKKILDKEKGNIWLTAISRYQTKTRKKFRYLEKQTNDIIKLCPLLTWKENEIWQYVKMKNLKYNKLYDKNYKSIGCQPCTTPTLNNEDSRSGRWRGDDKEECGLHVLEGDII